MPTVSKFYRRPPGAGWLLAAVAVPLILALIGWSAGDRSKDDGATAPSAASQSVSSSPVTNAPLTSTPGSVYAPLSVERNGKTVTLSGDVTDAAARTDLVDLLKRSFGADVNVVDNLSVKPGVNTPDLALIGSVFKSAAEIPDFALKLNGDTATLTGTAPSAAIRGEVEAAARLAWPNVVLVDSIQVNQAATPPPPPPTASPPTASPTTAPGPTGQCANLQGDINALLKTPISFATDGFTVSSGSRQALSQVAEKLKGCTDVKVSVVGHTDSSGNDAINNPLSQSRAKAVADYLVSQGIAADRISSRGAGAGQPIAPNDTPQGKAQNRRVEITVS